MKMILIGLALVLLASCSSTPQTGRPVVVPDLPVEYAGPPPSAQFSATETL